MQRRNEKIPTLKKKIFLNEYQISKMLLLFSQGCPVDIIAKTIGSNTRQVKKHIHDFNKCYTKKFTDEEYRILLEETQRGVLKDSEIAKKIGTKSYEQVRNEKRKKKFQNDLKNYCEFESYTPTFEDYSSYDVFDDAINDILIPDNSFY